MKIIKTKDYEEMSQVAVDIIRKQLKTKLNSVFTFPTGSTPERMYELLVSAYSSGKDNWSQVIAFNLDEYVGITRDNEVSYFRYMHSRFYDLINIKPENIHIPIGFGDMKKNIEKFTSAFKAAGVPDLTILGLGVNGHIGFNEPGTLRDSQFGLVKLSQSTIDANSRFFSKVEDVPNTAISMGMKEILSSKKILLIANGRAKAKAVAAMVQGPVSIECPASFLQEHKDVTIVIDEGASGYLE